ncbi:hypothetical protein HMPREF1487_09547 [Pseudomonas sp. HPB0071]|uniref:Uncharacterized protein n=1 Tax=Pseudomonas luteola TaxID=47886 RepID=A0A2X2CIN2_PSELU|nr:MULTISPECIES: hypothetical protein [Pseudomonas]ENA27068.1 hypothetical protein HMPREF1487_09547 [Pseudomonas sp. HPB0071]MBA1250108.1 hypothetical protein [Pseudomonas zeshuii]MBH3440858.1 hypothetical protein [Pseudomonas luteola]SPZ00025.1 Uncharacterised protein [Pseudomonas luteola]
MSGAKRFYATIDGEEIEGWVGKDKGGFRASADFRGKLVDVRGSSESDAIRKWRDKANHMANE